MQQNWKNSSWDLELGVERWFRLSTSLIFQKIICNLVFEKVFRIICRHWKEFHLHTPQDDLITAKSYLSLSKDKHLAIEVRYECKSRKSWTPRAPVLYSPKHNSCWIHNCLGNRESMLTLFPIMMKIKIVYR